MVYVVMGVAGCGKTTVGSMLASRLNISFIDADDYHPEKNIEKMMKGYALRDEDRMPWLRTLGRLIEDTLGRGEDMVLACSALKQSYRAALAGQNRDQVRFIYLKCDYEAVIRRMAGRSGHFMPSSLLESQYADLQEPEDAFVTDAAYSPERVVESIVDWIRKQ
ncbi:MAG: gluconokinase [Chitinispirillaceae bacterium]